MIHSEISIRLLQCAGAVGEARLAGSSHHSAPRPAWVIVSCPPTPQPHVTLAGFTALGGSPRTGNALDRVVSARPLVSVPTQLWSGVTGRRGGSWQGGAWRGVAGRGVAARRMTSGHYCSRLAAFR